MTDAERGVFEARKEGHLKRPTKDPLRSIEFPPRPTKDPLRQADGAVNPTERANLPNMARIEKGQCKADGSLSQGADRRLFQLNICIWSSHADTGNYKANISEIISRRL